MRVFFIFFLLFTGTVHADVNSLIETFGERKIIDFILTKSGNNSATVQVQNKLYIKYGRPSSDYVTPASIKYDFKRLGISEKDASLAIQAYIEKKTKREKLRQAKMDLAPVGRKIPKSNHIKNSDTSKFHKAIEKFFSKKHVQKIKYKNGAGSVVFNIDDDYFGTGDKINKICAISSGRLFANVPELQELKWGFNLTQNTRSYKKGFYLFFITRATIEDYYKMKFTPKLLENYYEPWRKQFIYKYDSKSKRAAFARKFVIYRSKK